MQGDRQFNNASDEIKGKGILLVRELTPGGSIVWCLYF